MNKIKNTGDNNYIFQDVKKSKINIGDPPNEQAKEKKKPNYALISIIIAILGLAASVIIGWDQLVQFFQ